MRDLLELLLRENACELQLKSGTSPFLSSDSAHLPIDVPALSVGDVHELLQSVASAEQLAELGRCGDLRFVYPLQHGIRFSITATLDSETSCITVRNLQR